MVVTRYLKYHYECKKNATTPVIDLFGPLKCKQIYGNTELFKDNPNIIILTKCE